MNGTTYNKETDSTVVALLERFRASSGMIGDRGPRITIEYGDVKTGKSWGDRETGRIGRSRGPVKIPIMLHNTRSMGGGGILDHCIVRVSYANKEDGGVLYQHPKYQAFHCTYCNTEHYVNEDCASGGGS